MTPDQLQRLLDLAIRNVLDVDAFNAEAQKESEDARFLQGVRNCVLKSLPDIADEPSDN